MSTAAGRTRIVTVVVVMMAAFATRSSSHPLATTAVILSQSADGYLTVTIDAESDALIAKLEALDNRPAVVVSTGTERSRRLQQLAPVLLRHLALTVDGSPIGIGLRDVVTDSSPQSAITLTAGVVPASARITWRCSFIFGSYPVIVRGGHGDERVEWVSGSAETAPLVIVDAQPSPGLLGGVAMGFTHIVPAGLDHILFVVGLFLLSRRGRDVMMQATVFTLAHSITLGLGAFGLVTVPAGICEPLIALSVAYVGIENLGTSTLRSGRLAVVFGFGLLHGLGFAEALSRLHLSTRDLLVTLFSFNLGVELGQLAVIALAALILTVIVRCRVVSEPFMARAASAAIGVAGVVWVVIRVG